MKPLCFSLVFVVIFVLAIVHAEAKPLTNADEEWSFEEPVRETDIGTGLKTLSKLLIRVARRLYNRLKPLLGEEKAARIVLGIGKDAKLP